MAHESPARGSGTHRVGRLTAGAAALATAATLVLPAAAGAQGSAGGSLGAGPLASVAGLIPAGSSGSLFDLAFAVGGRISAPDVTVQTQAGGTDLALEQTNTAPHGGAVIPCWTAIIDSEDVPDSPQAWSDLVLARPANGAIAALYTNSSPGDDTDAAVVDDSDFIGEFGDGSPGSGDGDYTVVTWCLDDPYDLGDPVAFGSGAVGGLPIRLNGYINADVTLAGGEFTVSDAGGTGSAGSLSSLASTGSSGS